MASTALLAAADDLFLSRRAASGDATALNELLDRARCPLLRRIQRKIPQSLRAVVSAEDVLQEASLDVIRALPSFDPTGPGAFAKWLGRIADRRLLDLVRAQGRTKRGGGKGATAAGSPEPVIDRLPDEDPAAAPDARLACDEARAALRRAMARLPVDHQLALRLRYDAGLDWASIAARLGRSEGATLMLASRAMARLRNTLSPYCPAA